jgi:dolichol-phosphate mannosyltransferase
MDSLVDVSVVIPVYNNSESIRELTERLLGALNECCGGYEIIYVNDGSHDNSLAKLRMLASEVFAVKVINLSRNFGQHPAMCAGFERASGQVIILMDADLQDRPEDIAALLQKMRSDSSDVVYTTRRAAVGAPPRLSTSRLFHYVFGNLINASVPPSIGTFRAFNRKFLEAILQFRESNIIYGPLMFYIGFKSSFLELPYCDRPHGRSSYTFKKRLQLAINSLITYTDAPHRLTMWLGVTLMLGSLLYALIVSIEYFLFGSSLPGGSTLILLLITVSFGAIMMTLGVIGSYVFRVYQEVLRRPRYLVQEIINFSKDAE